MTDALFDDATKSAILSTDGRYRYWLCRQWAVGPAATFIMLNPSTADASIDDPTIRRCVGFAKSWGMGGLVVINLYALRSTDPRGLWSADDPVGPENDEQIEAAVRLAAGAGSPLVAAWGAHAKLDRAEQVVAMAGTRHLQHLGLTKAGAPRHPLYLSASTQLQPWGEW